MSRPNRRLFDYICFLFLATNGEEVKWCGTEQSPLAPYIPMTRFYARGKIHCVVLSHRHRNTYYQWQTIEYRDRQCTLYAETTETEVCSETMKTGYWSKRVSNI